MSMEEEAAVILHETEVAEWLSCCSGVTKILSVHAYHSASDDGAVHSALVATGETTACMKSP
jgi:hypothetical protein